jgi:uncharacterized RDD family membrane protein YckC
MTVLPTTPQGSLQSPPCLTPLATPSLRRRMACFVYEGVMLFGVVMGAGLIYGLLAGQHNALAGRHGLQAVLFLVLGAYFTWFWSHGGQTVAMKTWQVRLTGADGGPASVARCFVRYLHAWLWFLPALVALWLRGLPGPLTVAAVMVLGVLGYAGLALLRPDRQFMHDVLCGTRLVTSRAAPRAALELSR